MTQTVSHGSTFQNPSPLYQAGTHSIMNQTGSSLPYYPPEPRETFRLNPLALKSFKNLDVDDLQDCFGRSLQQRRNQEVTKQTEVQKIYDEDKGIQFILSTIKQAKLNRDRGMQICDGQARRMQNLVKDAELDEKVLENLGEEQRLEQEKERRRHEENLKNKAIIQQQMKDREKDREESRKEYERDKQQVQAIMDRIRQENQQQYEENQRKKALARSYMESAYAEKAEMKRKAKEDERLQKEKERKYFEDVARREFEHQAKKKAIQD